MTDVKFDPILGKPRETDDASEIGNDSSVAGATVKDALETLAAGSSPDNFSYNEIYKDITIPEHQQMIVIGDIDDSHGYTLDVQGEVVTENRDYLLDIHSESMGDLSDVSYSGLADDKILMWHTNRWIPVDFPTPPAVPVTSVNGQIGDVVLDADDIDDTSTTHKFVTAGDITKLSNLSGTNTGDQDSDTVSNVSTVTGLTVSDALETLDSDIGDVASDVSDIQSDIGDIQSDLSHKNTFVITETNGKIDNIVVNGDDSYDFNYDVYGMFSSITDGTNTWNFTNDKNGGEIRVVA